MYFYRNIKYRKKNFVKNYVILKVRHLKEFSCSFVIKLREAVALCSWPYYWSLFSSLFNQSLKQQLVAATTFDSSLKFPSQGGMNGNSITEDRLWSLDYNSIFRNFFFQTEQIGEFFKLALPERGLTCDAQSPLVFCNLINDNKINSFICRK